MMRTNSLDIGFGFEKRTLRTLSPCDFEIVAGGISDGGVVATVVAVGVTVMSSIECTPIDMQIATLFM